MATKIPIWPGSSSFFPGDTPFGLYDTDTTFQNDIETTSVWAARRLGHPIVDVELQDINFYTCFEEAVTEYSSQVNYYNIKENLLSLKGTATGSDLTHREITPNFGRLITISSYFLLYPNI